MRARAGGTASVSLPFRILVARARMKRGTWLRLAAAAVLAAVLLAGVAEAKKKSKGEAEITHTVRWRRAVSLSCC